MKQVSSNVSCLRECFLITAKLQKYFLDYETSLAILSALGWEGNDWILVFGWSYPLTQINVPHQLPLTLAMIIFWTQTCCHTISYLHEALNQKCKSVQCQKKYYTTLHTTIKMLDTKTSIASILVMFPAKSIFLSNRLRLPLPAPECTIRVFLTGMQNWCNEMCPAAGQGQPVDPSLPKYLA